MMEEHRGGPSPLLEDYLAWLDGLCSTCLSIQQAQCPEAFQGRGVVVPESQVTLALSGQAPMEPQAGFADHLDQLRRRATQSQEPLAVLFRRLEAGAFQQLVILLALAPQVNRKYERVFAYLQDDAQARQATLGLAADLYALVAPLEEGELFALGDQCHPLNRYLLVCPAGRDQGAALGLARPLVLRQTALLALTGASYLPEPLPPVCSLLSAEEQVEPLTHQELCQQATAFASHFLAEDRRGTGLLQLYGRENTGRRFILRYLAGRTGRNVLCIDCGRLAVLGDDAQSAILETALSWCWLNRAVPALYHFDFTDHAQGACDHGGRRKERGPWICGMTKASAFSSSTSPSTPLESSGCSGRPSPKGPACRWRRDWTRSAWPTSIPSPRDRSSRWYPLRKWTGSPEERQPSLPRESPGAYDSCVPPGWPSSPSLCPFPLPGRI